MERIRKMVPWERKVENERERGLLSTKGKDVPCYRCSNLIPNP